MVIGIILAVFGFVWLLLKYILKLLKIRRFSSPTQGLYNKLTIREMEYLDFVKKKNIPLYNDLLEELKKEDYFGKPPKRQAPQRPPNAPQFTPSNGYGYQAGQMM